MSWDSRGLDPSLDPRQQLALVRLQGSHQTHLPSEGAAVCGCSGPMKGRAVSGAMTACLDERSESPLTADSHVKMEVL